jgi:stage III sporulation protein AE
MGVGFLKRVLICTCFCFCLGLFLGAGDGAGVVLGESGGGVAEVRPVAPVEIFTWDPSSSSSSSDALQEEIMNELQSELHLDEAFDLFALYEAEVREFLPGFSFGQFFKDLLAGEGGLGFESILRGILSFAVKTFVVNGPLISKLIILAIFCAVLNQLQLAFGGQVSQVARLLSVFVLIGLAVSAFRVALEVAVEAIDGMVAFMQAILPLMFTVLLAMGNLTSTALFKPVVIGSLAVLATIIKNVILPLFFLAVVLKLLNSVSQQFKLDKLANLLEWAGKIGIGLVMTVFLGVMSVQGVAGGVSDGVAIRTAKYSVDLVPVVGKYFKDAVELVISSGMLLKNALGIMILVALVFITLIPVLKIAAMALTFHLTAALVEPLGEKELAGALQCMGKGMQYIFATVAAVGLMFFLTVVIVVGVGTFSVMIQ